jgi:protein PhnA
MSLEKQLMERSGSCCELCGSTDSISSYPVPPNSNENLDDSILTCEKCKNQIEKKESLDESHWACLNTAMWSEVPAVKVVAWRMLNRLKKSTWAADALEMMYMEDELMPWAKATGDQEDDGEVELHRDCNGAVLQTGDSVVLIKTLDVKGSSLSAKVGTAVKNIRLVPDNTEQIEGKVEGQQIVILTKYVKKSS